MANREDCLNRIGSVIFSETEKELEQLLSVASAWQKSQATREVPGEHGRSPDDSRRLD